MGKKAHHQQYKLTPAMENIQAAWRIVSDHPLFSPLLEYCYFTPMFGYYRRITADLPQLLKGWAVITRSAVLDANTSRLADVGEWVYVFAHCLLHLGFDHFHPPADYTTGGREALAWNAACDVFITRFLADLKFGSPPEIFRHLSPIPLQSEETFYRRFLAEGIPDEYKRLGTNQPGELDMVFDPLGRFREKVDWPARLGIGLAQAVSAAISVAGGTQATLVSLDERSLAQQARIWFINHYPLLGSLAATFKIIEDPALCGRRQISVAAIDEEMQEIYLNPAAGMDERETRFVLAHEMLHAGLRHTVRCQGRDPYLWNVACDYVINGWLVEMGLGALPQFGGLYDPQLQGLSAESIYDRVVTDLRRYRKLATLRGVGLGDMLEKRPGTGELNGESLDDFYRRCLSQGLVYHQAGDRGLLPGNLVEEIQALGQPPIPWDVALARWFDDHFPALEMNRSYSRPSRRQSATPEIPRPSYIRPPGDAARTFGVILDTSGSMDHRLLAKALGAISSYSLSRDVPFVRVVFCDAAVYDQGFLSPEEIAGRVQVRGRGGTVLQPGIDLLERLEDFPRDGPLLIITDGRCDRLQIKREHAYLMPAGRHLPFIPRGEVFYIQD